MKNINNYVNFILFLLNTIFIFSSELIRYIYSNDYDLLINNLTLRLSKLNILYVKIFQAFALNNNLIDEKINQKLLDFTDNVPWKKSDIDLNTINEITNKYNLHITNYSPKNAGMISLVFFGYDNENKKKIIIKIKRKNIQEKLDISINNLLLLIYLLSFIPIVNTYKFKELIYTNIELIRQQTNFIKEVKNMNEMKENCKKLKYIIIPKVNEIITKEYNNVIVMEYIEGLKINQINNLDCYGFAKSILKFGIITCVIHGFSHGDLHCGNILFIKDENDQKYPYKLGILDFGVVIKISENYKILLFELLTQLFTLKPREIAEKILNSDIIEPKGILKKIPLYLYHDILNVIEEIISDCLYIPNNASQEHIYKALSKCSVFLKNKNISNLNIKLCDDFVKAQLVLAMTQGVTLTLCNGNFISLIDEVITELFIPLHI